MPYFSNAGSVGLVDSIRRTIEDSTPKPNTSRIAERMKKLFSGGDEQLDPMMQIRVEQAAADTAHKLTQTDALRQKTGLEKKLDELRSDPAQQDAFAGDVAGVDRPTGRRIGGHLRGEHEPWNVADQDDADAVGAQLRPYRMAAPNVDNRIVRAFQDGSAALLANQFATGKTNAEQLMHAVQRGQENRILAAATEAAERGDVTGVNLRAAGVLGKKELTPFKTDTHGITTNEYTGVRDETGPGARAARTAQDALATQRRASAGASSAHAGLFNAQTGKVQAETEKIVDDAAVNGDSSLAGRAFFETTGVKLSTIAPEARLAWIKNHATGMGPTENLASLMPKGGTDVLMREARQAYETMYPKTMMGQRDPRAPNFLDFADQYIAQKQGGERVPQPAPGGRTAGGTIRPGGAPAPTQQLARPKTQAEFEALPRGAVYIDPDDGKTYRKR